MKNEASTGYKYDFEIKINSMKIEYKLPFNFRLLCKRGNKQTEIDKTFKYDPTSNREVNINETFNISCIMKPETEKFDFSNPLFAEKKYKIYLCIYTKTGFKPAISGEFNLADFVSRSKSQINKLNEMVLSNKTFTDIKIKYAINSNFVAECDVNQLGNDANQTNAEDFSRVENNDNQDYGGLVAAGNSVNNNVNSGYDINNMNILNPNAKQQNSTAVSGNLGLDVINKTNNNNIGYDNSKKFEDRIPVDLNTNINKNADIDKISESANNTNFSNTGGSSNNKIKLTLKTAAATDLNNNIANSSTFNNVNSSSQNGIFDKNANNTNQKAIDEGFSQEKAATDEFRLTISKLQNKLTEEEKEKQDLIESQRKRDLEFISLIEENEDVRSEIAKFKEQETCMLDELSKLKSNLDQYALENKELQNKNNLMQQKIESLNSSISNLNETIKDLNVKARSIPQTSNQQPSGSMMCFEIFEISQIIFLNYFFEFKLIFIIYNYLREKNNL